MLSLAAAAGVHAAQNGKQLPPAGGGQCAVVTAFIKASFNLIRAGPETPRPSPP